MMVGLLKDLTKEGHESENYWFERLMSDASPNRQEKYYANPVLTPPHDTDLGKIMTLHKLVRGEKPNRILELWVKRGFSTYGILSALAANGGGVLISIDKNDFAMRGRRTGHLAPDSIRKFWELRIGEAGDLLPSLGTFDLIFEDYGARLGDTMLPALWDKLNLGGFLFISSRVVKPDFDAFAQQSAGWFAKAEDAKNPMAAWGLLRKP
jgi:predicted O-methyltransferase YrrM